MAVHPAPPVRAYWDTAAETYDQDFTGTLIGQTRRDAVWRELDRVFASSQRVLELNCGTGVDALHLAEKGIDVLACDLSPRMIELARQRAAATPFGNRIRFRVLANEEIAALHGEAPFDGAFSNFSGLNCVDDLAAVARNLKRLLRPGAPVLLSMLGRVVPWEIAWFLAHGDFHRAVQRCRGSFARPIESGILTVRYPSVREITAAFAAGFRLRRWRGIGIAVPPSYMNSWARRAPRAIRTLAAADAWLGALPLLRALADCVVLELHRIEIDGADHGAASARS